MRNDEVASRRAAVARLPPPQADHAPVLDAGGDGHAKLRALLRPAAHAVAGWTGSVISTSCPAHFSGRCRPW